MAESLPSVQQLTMEQLQHFTVSMQQAFAAQQQQLEAVQRQLQEQQRQPLHFSSSSSAVPVRRDETQSTLSRLLSKPSIFRGEHGTKVFDWISEFELLFPNLESAAHLDEAQKISFAKQFLREEALRWWMAREHDVAANNAPVIRTWDDFKKALVEFFRPRGASEAARAEIHRMRQHQFRDLEAYADRFQTVSRMIEVPVGHSIEQELISSFKNGLNDGQIRLYLTQKEPQSLSQAAQLAVQAESDLRVSRVHLGGRQESRHSFRPSHDQRHFNGRAEFRNHHIRPFPAPHAPFHHGSTRPNGHEASRATPMELGVIGDSSEAESDGPPERGLSDSNPDRASSATPPSSASSPEDEPCQRRSQGDTELNMFSRPRRFSRDRSVRKSEGCWNCGGMDHFSRDCRVNTDRHATTAAAASSTMKAGNRSTNRPSKN